MSGMAFPLILASSLLVANADRYPDADEVFACRFEADWDVNFDQWPDGWTRKRGPGYPRYLPIGLRAEMGSAASGALVVDLDGHAAAVYSPPAKFDSRCSYVLEASIRTEGLQHSVAVLTLTVLDDSDHELETFTSQPVSGDSDWQRVRLGPVSVSHDEAEKAVIGLHVEPTTKSDLRGTVRFDDVWLGRLPRMTVEMSEEPNYFRDPDQVEIRVRISGVRDEQPEVHLSLLDAVGNRLHHEVRRSEPPPAAASGAPTGNNRPQDARHPTDNPNLESPSAAARPALPGTIDWKPPIDGAGYYAARVSMQTSQGVLHEKVIPLAVLKPLSETIGGEFGWTLPGGDEQISLDTLERLLPIVGINWLKFPLWYSAEDSDRGRRLLKFAQRLEAERIQLVGILDQPPSSKRSREPDALPVMAATTFSPNSDAWLATLDPVMTRLSLKIHYWQLGGDRDTSFVDYPDLSARIRQVREKLFRLGQKAYLGFGWRWLSTPPSAESPPWDFVTYSEDPPLTADELATYLEGLKNQPRQRWVLVDPLPASQFDLATRVQDLVRQMVSAKRQHADAIFVPDPLHPDRGLVRQDASPTPLLLPWRTTASVLGGMHFLGSIRTPNGSRNYLFSRDGRTVMVVWNEEPVREVLYLGHDVRQIDVWGRVSPARTEDHRQVIDVTPLPLFLTGIDESVARWRMNLTLDTTYLPSIFGQSHPNVVRTKNTFQRGVNGTLAFSLPHGWSPDPSEATIRLTPGQALELPFEITLPLGASGGVHDVRIDLDISSDRRYVFSVYRQVEIGLGDIEVQVSTRLEEDGTLTLEQRTIHSSDTPITFRFHVYAPNRRSKRAHVIELGRGEDVKYYRFRNGSELVGQTLWLRAEEINGPRTFNHRFIVEE